MLTYCKKWGLMIEENNEYGCYKCIHYTLTDQLQENIKGYECSYEEDK
jgi:hypothetical protein